MAALASRYGRTPQGALAPVGLLGLALVVGVLGGMSPMLGVVVVAALVFALVVVWDLTLGLCLFALVAFLDVVSRNQNLSLTKGAGAVLAASWLALMATRRGSRRDFAANAPWLMAALIAFLAWSLMSSFWAESRSAALQSTERYGLDVILVPIVFWAVRDRKHVTWVFGVFVAGTLLSVLWGLTAGKVAGGAAAAQVGRLSGANVEANELASLLVVCMVFAGTLTLVIRRAPVARVLIALGALGAIVAFFGTFSRGGLISLAVAILAGCFYGGRARSAFVALVIGVVLVGGVFLGDNTSGAVQRLTSSDTSGRSSIWTVALRMARANPIIGVGSGNFQVAEPHYLLTSPGLIARSDLIVTTPLPAHNIYLQALAEMGVIGLALLLAVLGLSVGAAIKAISLFRDQGDRSLEILSRGLVVALAGLLASDFFQPDQYSKQLWLLLAMGPALLAIARRSSEAPRADLAPGRLSATPPEPVWQP